MSVLSINNVHPESSQHMSSIIQTGLKGFTLERILYIIVLMLYTKRQIRAGHISYYYCA